VNWTKERPTEPGDYAIRWKAIGKDSLGPFALGDIFLRKVVVTDEGPMVLTNELERLPQNNARQEWYFLGPFPLFPAGPE
jgi:hypothetical protein